MHAHEHAAAGRAGSRRALVAVLALTAGFALLEAVGGWLTRSLALVADAGHMASDASALALALGAAWLAGRPATPSRSFGFARAEVIAALVNGLALVAVGVWVLWEAWTRLSEPPDVRGGWMLAVAVVGLAVNVVAARILTARAHASLNVRAALRHVLADAVASVGVVAAALVVLLTGWREADPLIGAVVGFLVLASSYGILRESLAILLESSPRGVDAGAVGRAMAAERDVVEVHDLHIWTITSGFPALAAHVLVGPAADCHSIRRGLEAMLHERFGIDHTTLQVEHAPAPIVELGAVERRRAPLGRQSG